MKLFKLNVFIVLLALVPSIVLASEKNKDTKALDNESAKSVVDVSIIGNSELPKVSFNLPWRLPSVEKREDQSPSVDIQNMLDPIEPVRHKQLVHFSRYLEVDLPSFRTR